MKKNLITIVSLFIIGGIVGKLLMDKDKYTLLSDVDSNGTVLKANIEFEGYYSEDKKTFFALIDNKTYSIPSENVHKVLGYIKEKQNIK